MKSILFVLAVAALGLTACSPAVSIRPLYAEKEKTAVEPKIEGEWVTPDFEQEKKEATHASWKVHSGSVGRYSVELNTATEKEDKTTEEASQFYDVRLVELAGKTFFDAEFVRSVQGANQFEPSNVESLMAPVHIVGRAWVQQDYLRLALPDSGWLKDGAPPEFRAMAGATAVITALNPELSKFYLEHSEDPKVFPFIWHLCRAGTDCIGRAVEDELARRPDDPEVISGAAKFYYRRGSYQKALSVRRHMAEIQPNVERKEDLGTALLFNRDFKGARQAFVEAAKLSDKAGSDQEEIGWTYFLEGDYAQAQKALSNPSPSNRSATPILLSYYSLLRMGRRQQAQAFLRDQTGRFIGSPHEHFLLLDSQDRMFPAGASGESDQDRAESSFFHGLWWLLVKSDPKSGWADFEETVRLAEPDSIVALAARIEIERIGKGK